jgi:hypothetical protein
MIPQGFGFLKQVFADQTEFDKAMGFVGPATGLPLLVARFSPVRSSTPTCGTSDGAWSSSSTSRSA